MNRVPARTMRRRRRAAIPPRASRHLDRVDLVVLLDLVDHVHALRDLAEHRMHAGQMPLRCVTDEELRAAGILSGMRHGQRAGHVLVLVETGFALDGVPGPAGPDASLARLGVGIAALNHEIRNHAVERGPVIESFLRQFFEVGDGAGHFVGEELELDDSLDGIDHGLGGCHHCSSARLSSTCFAVFIPTITTPTSGLSSTKRKASWDGETRDWWASSRTRAPRAAIFVTYGRGMRARMSPAGQVASGP